MYKKSILLFLQLTLFLSIGVHAQDLEEKLDIANSLYKNEHYRNALPYYEDVLKENPNHVEALFKSGVSYLHRFSKEKALQNILKSFELDSNYNKHIRYWMGRAYQMNYEFDKALTCYTIYKNSIRKRDQRSEDLVVHIRQTETGAKLFKDPKDYIVRNLGPNVNSPYSDHSPVISSDGKSLYLTSRRKDGSSDKEELDGEPFEDILICTKQADGTWSKPETIHLNTSGHDATNQLYDNDSKLLIYKFHKGGDIYMTEKNGDRWSDPKPFPEINTKKYESSAFLTQDGKRIYFSTNRYKKNDDLDIYYLEKMEDGSWSQIKELKGNINTRFDEDAPYLSPDGKTMYFSSRGHDNMGGFDIFRSSMNDEGYWSEPENLGFPINTPDDDVYYYPTSNFKKGYISSYRSDGLGEKDIYEIQPMYGVVIEGLVLEDSTNRQMNGYTVTYESKYKTTRPNSAKDISKDSGKYSARILCYNTYKISISKDGQFVREDSLVVPLADDEGTRLSKNVYVPIDRKTLPPPVAADTKHRYIFRNTYFAKNSATLSEEAKHELDIAAEILKKNPESNVVINGNYKKPESAKTGENRAKAVQEYLVSKGVKPENIKTGNATSNEPQASLDVKLKKPLNLDLDPSIIARTSVGGSFVLRHVYFNTAKAELKPEGKAELDTLRNIMMDFPDLKIELGGHTDDIGNDTYNQQLSESRAKAAMEYLIKNGVPANRLSYKGYGEVQPYLPNDSDKNRLLNRRTEATILSK
jgi:outer membrane protein OmpA-like peptidoglycan-associated protein